DIVRAVKAKGATLKATEQPFDTGNIYGELTVNLLGCFAEFETNLRRERQSEGIAKAKAAGVYKGRPASIDPSKIRDLKHKGLGASEIAKTLKIGRASVYRALGGKQSPSQSLSDANSLDRSRRFVWGPGDVEH